MDIDIPLATETRHETPQGEFYAVLLPEGVMDVKGGWMSTSEANGGGWRPVEVYWTTDTDDSGESIQEDGGVVESTEIIDASE